jgi:hypothetical protein
MAFGWLEPLIGKISVFPAFTPTVTGLATPFELMIVVPVFPAGLNPVFPVLLLPPVGFRSKSRSIELLPLPLARMLADAKLTASELEDAITSIPLLSVEPSTPKVTLAVPIVETVPSFGSIVAAGVASPAVALTDPDGIWLSEVVPATTVSGLGVLEVPTFIVVSAVPDVPTIVSGVSVVPTVTVVAGGADGSRGSDVSVVIVEAGVLTVAVGSGGADVATVTGGSVFPAVVRVVPDVPIVESTTNVLPPAELRSGIAVAIFVPVPARAGVLVVFVMGLQTTDLVMDDLLVG